MHRIIAFLALSLGSCAHGQLLPMNLPSRGLAADLPAGNMPAMLMLRANNDCGSNSKSCDDGCIPEEGQCCNTGEGGWCSSGTRCQTGGCCPDGQDCSGPAAACADGAEFCGSKCMPQGAQCCPQNNYYCASGTSCTSNGLCDDGRGVRGCTSDEESCGGGCMPAGKRCCSTHYCPTEFNCGSAAFECTASMSQGGKGNGDGPAALCAGDFESCGISCMPKGSVCCDGFYCPAGASCAPDQKCATSDGEVGAGGGSPGDDGSDSDNENGASTSSTTASSTSSPTVSPSSTETGSEASVTPGAANQVGAGKAAILAGMLAAVPLVL